MTSGTGHTDYGNPAGLVVMQMDGNTAACRNNGMEVLYVLR